MNEITISPALETEAEEVLELLKSTLHFQDYTQERFLRNFQNPDYLRHRQEAGACAFLLRDRGKPIGFTESVCRELWLKQEMLLACIGGTLYLKEGEKEALPNLIYTLFDQPCYNLNLANTANKKSAQINKILRSLPGPPSCEFCRFRVLSTHSYLLYASGKLRISSRIPLLVRKWASFLAAPLFSLFSPFRAPSLPPEKITFISRQIQRIDPDIFDLFWEELLAGNQGLLTSRRTDVLEWTFGKGLKTGRYTILGRFDKTGRLQGEITLERRRNESGSLYRVVDWIALRKDQDVLGDLLRDAVLFAAREKGFLIELVGFEEKVQPLIAAYLTGKRRLSHGSNTFFVRFKDKQLKKDAPRLADDGWFYGPFDGDSCWA